MAIPASTSGSATAAASSAGSAAPAAEGKAAAGAAPAGEGADFLGMLAALTQGQAQAPVAAQATALVAATDPSLAQATDKTDTDLEAPADGSAAALAALAQMLGTASVMTPVAKGGQGTPVSSAAVSTAAASGAAGLAGDAATRPLATALQAAGTAVIDSLLTRMADKADASTFGKLADTPPQTAQPQFSPQATPSAVTPDATAADAAQPRLHESVGSERWADALGARLTMMATRGEQHGSLRLSPEHLGPLEVQIRVQDDKASVWFGAQHADTRAALQEALPRLRELFAASGMQLGDAGVSQQAPRQNATPADPLDRRRADVLTAATEGVVPVPPQVARHLGLLDTYA